MDIIKEKNSFDNVLWQKKEEIIEITNETEIEVTSVTVSSLIHIIRGKQVILDSDLAMLYQVETGAMNRAVKRNKKQFPEDFCFERKVQRRI